MRINNNTDSERDVTVTISSDGTKILDEDHVVSSGDHVSVETGISEPGTYQIQILTDDRRDTSTVAIEEYDIENDLAIIVEISASSIRTILQE